MKQPLFKSILMISVLSFTILGLMISTAISGGPVGGRLVKDYGRLFHLANMSSCKSILGSIKREFFYSYRVTI